MNALEIAKKLGKKEALDKIRQSGLREHGVYTLPLAEKLESRLGGHGNENQAEGFVHFLAGALNNEDTDYMLLSLLREYPKQVLDGLAAAAYLAGAEKALLYLPESEGDLKQDLEEFIARQQMDIQVIAGMVDARTLSEGIAVHIETLYMLSDVLLDCYTNGSRVCIKRAAEHGWEYTEPVFAAVGKTLGQALESILDKSEIPDIKAVWMGHKLYGLSIFSEEITEETNFGNGVITIFDKNACLVKEAENILLEHSKAACGKCAFCREGMNQLYTRLREITLGKGDIDGLDIMEEIAKAMEFSTLCSMGQTGGAIVSETIKHQMGEYEDHIKRKRCTAGTCLAFIHVYIQPDRCSGCQDCIPACPVDCIEGLPGYIHMVEDLDCTKCGACLAACPREAIVKTVVKPPLLPDRLTRIGRFKRY